MKKNILVPVLLLLSVALAAQQPPAVTIAGTQRISFNSKIVGQDYEILVHLPGNYTEQINARYPVLYLLDAQWDFPFVTGVYGGQYYDGFIPGIIIVGITWGGKNADYDLLRRRDFTPLVNGQPAGEGNAPKFLSFIKKELIPYIDSAFRTSKKDRVLAGSSLGGLFTLYAMFEETALFNKYVLTSPALGWGNGVIHQHEKLFAEKKQPIHARLFMAHGEMEGPKPFEEFVEHMKKRQYAGLEMQTRVLENTGHSGTKPEGYARGLQWVFAKPSLKLLSTLLKSYAGKYQLDNETITITEETGKLVAITPDHSKVAFDAETESDFYLRGQFLFLHFKKDNAGKVTGFQIQQFRSETFAKKIND